jgi:hypothetical protein
MRNVQVWWFIFNVDLQRKASVNPIGWPLIRIFENPGSFYPNPYVIQVQPKKTCL